MEYSQICNQGLKYPTTWASKEKHSIRTVPFSNKGRTALKAYLLQNKINSQQLKSELQSIDYFPTPITKAAQTAPFYLPTARPAKLVSFDLSSNTTKHLPSTHSKKKQWYSKLDYDSFREANQKNIEDVILEDHIFHKTTSIPISSTSCHKQRLLRLYAISLLKPGSLGNSGAVGLVCGGNNATASKLLQVGWNTKDVTKRGLESSIITDMALHRKYYVRSLVQYGHNCCSDEDLRLTSIKMTKASREFAHILGCVDAAACRQNS